MNNPTGNELLALIAARGGSRGLPGKNIRPLAGLPLIAHSILLARMCPSVKRVIVSTDSAMIADVARQFGGEVPFLRPSELAQDDTPVWEAVRHALYAVEEMQGTRYDSLLLLDPTVPARMPEDIERAFERLWDTRRADGIVGVSQPEFDPISCGVVERDGWVTELVEGGAQYTRRQDVPSVYLINATLYIWRTEFVRQEKTSWRKGRLLIYQIPDHRVVHTDDIFQFERADVLIKSGFIKLPWLKKKGA